MAGLESSGLAEWIRQSLWLYPLLEIFHILSFSSLFGAILLWDLRLLGVSRRLPLNLLAQHLFPWVYLGFGGAIATGIGLLAVDATAITANPAFRLKLLLMLLASLNAVVYQLRFSHSINRWDARVSPPLPVKAIALVSLVSWIGVIICGRLIAYL